MLLYILLGIGAAAAIGAVVSRKKSAEKLRVETRQAAVSGANVTNDISRVGQNGVLMLPAFGANRAPVETYVKKRHRYSDGQGDTWFELVCEQANRALLVEWYRGGGELRVTGGYEDENPTLEALGLTEEDLVRFDEDENGSFQWDGVTWRYHSSGEQFFSENGSGPREGYYGWSFREPSGNRSINVEKWEDDADFDVYHLWRIEPDQIEVYDAGETT